MRQRGAVNHLQLAANDRLEQRLESETIKEVILATNPTVEGEATANYIAELCAQYGVDASRIARAIRLASTPYCAHSSAM